MPGDAGGEGITTHVVHLMTARVVTRPEVAATGVAGVGGLTIVVIWDPPCLILILGLPVSGSTPPSVEFKELPPLCASLSEYVAGLLQSGATFSGSLAGLVTPGLRTLARDSRGVRSPGSC